MSGEKKDPDAIPMLKYGPGNNFMKFKEALSKKALQEYGKVGRLNLKERLVRPAEPDPINYNTDATNPNARLEELKYIEDIKVHRKKVTDMERDMPKLYAFILKYLSDESLEAVKKDANWDAIEDGTDPEGLWRAVIEKHKVHSACEVESIMQLSARVQLHQCKHGSF
jgi:hypothetical protein